MRTLLVLVTSVLFALAGAARGAEQPAALSAVPTDSFAFVTVNVGKLWDNPGFKPLRGWFESQKTGPTDEALGLSLADIDRITAFVPVAGRDPFAAVLVATKKPYNEAKVLKSLAADANNRQRRAGNVVRLEHGPFAVLVLVDDRTLLFMPNGGDELSVAGLLGQVLAKKSDGPLAAALGDAAKHDIAFALDAGPLAGFVRADREPGLAPYLALFKARTVAFAADFDKTAVGTFRLTFADEAAARRAAPVLKEGISELVDAIEKETQRNKERSEPTQLALVETVAVVLKSAKVEAVGTNVIATAELAHPGAVTKIAAALPKSYAATVNSARGQNNLKQLALAFHNFESAYAFFPSDVLPIPGPKPPAMSWRVQILPFIEHDNLYKQLDLTKAWDDPANLKKLEAMEMPKVFEIPGRPAPKGYTYFRVFSLPKGAKGTDRPFFTEGQKGGRITDIADGTSNTFMIVEAGEAVPWYKPDLLSYDGKLPLPQLGDKAADRFIVAMGDGSVRVLRPSKTGEQNLRAFITIQGGEVISLP